MLIRKYVNDRIEEGVRRGGKGKLQKLADYQKRVVHTLNRSKAKKILVEAPVGSGKTIMLGAYLAEQHRAGEGIPTLWISSGKGQLVEQSIRSIEKHYSNLNALDITQYHVEQPLRAGQVLGINWEKVRSNENRLRNEQFLEKMPKGIQVIIDESHEGSHTDLAKQVLASMEISRLIRVSATPRPQDREEVEEAIKVHYHEVQEAGFMKQGVILNEGLVNTTIPRIIEASVKKLEEIRQAKKQQGSPLEPLCLIQLEDGRDSEQIAEIQRELKKQGVQENRIAIWLSNRKERIEDLQTSQVNYLIFKRAIAVGWDCPRSHILVKFREPRNHRFDIQTVGRILRSEGLQRYNSRLLDYGYVYTAYEHFEMEIEQQEQYRVIGERKEHAYVAIPLKGTKLQQKKTRPMSYYINQQLPAILRILDRKPTTPIQMKKTVGEWAFDEANLSKKDVEHREEEINERYYRLLHTYNEKYGIGTQLDRAYSRKKEQLVAKADQFRMIVEKIEQTVKEKSYIAQPYVYRTPDQLAGLKRVTGTKNLYDVETVKDSQNEEYFEKYLAEDTDVEAYYKNPVGTGYSIVYTDGEQSRSYYPDYIIYRKGKIEIVDVKAKEGQGDYGNVKAKYEAGKALEADQTGTIPVEITMVKRSEAGYWYKAVGDTYTPDMSKWERYGG